MSNSGIFSIRLDVEVMVVAPDLSLQSDFPECGPKIALDEIPLFFRGPVARGVMHLWLMLPVNARFVLNRYGVDWDSFALVCLDELHEVSGVCAVPFRQQPAADHGIARLHPARR